MNLPPGKGVVMLLLSRQLGEKLIIGESVTVTVISVKGKQVGFGIDAPRHIRVNREERAPTVQMDIQIVNQRACM